MLVSGTVEPGVLRVVTHLGISDADIERAVDGIRTALGPGDEAVRIADVHAAVIEHGHG